MVVCVPFVFKDDIPNNPASKRFGAKYVLVTGNGQIEQVGESFNKSHNHLGYRASPSFVQDYGQLLPLGNIFAWNRKRDFIAWIDRIIYHSFVIYSKEGVDKAWMMNTVYQYSSTTETIIPPGFSAGFEGERAVIWILLKHGNKAYPVKVVDNVFLDGWSDFRCDHQLRPNFKLLFGCERKWIFEVLILNANQVEEIYPWTRLKPSWTEIYPTPDTLVTAHFPTVLAAYPACYRFGYYYIPEINTALAFQSHFNRVFPGVDRRELKVVVGNFSWTIPIIDGRLDDIVFENFISDLGIQEYDYLFVSIIDEIQIALVVIDSYDAEKTLAWL